MTRLAGVIFDLGGVVFDSPIERIADFERRERLEPQTVAGVIRSQPGGGAWSRFERGELEREAFIDAFSKEFLDMGLGVDVSALLDDIESALVVRPAMLNTIDRLRSSGLTVAALTNNWSPMSDLPIAAHFDVFVESVREGCRKPEPEIYRRTLDRMGRDPDAVAMLDDLGENLKTARSMGMTTHRVVTVASAIDWLGATFGIEAGS
jgi:putative hydrolase of the HAD superfamily